MPMTRKHVRGAVAHAARTILLAVLLLVPLVPGASAQVFQEPDAFLQETFSQNVRGRAR